MWLRPRPAGAPDTHLWTDWPDAAQRVRQGGFQTDADILSRFIDAGYATLTRAVADDAAIAAFLAALQTELSRADTALQMSFWASGAKHIIRAMADALDLQECKVLDVHRHIPASHQLIFAPPILAFLRDCFNDDVIAFQTLYFEYGSEQGAHNDTAFVYVDPPDMMIASWIALEDIEAGSGNLFLYPGSHAIGEQIFANGGRAYDPADEHAASYSHALDAMMAAHGLLPIRYQPKRGDALFWSSNIVHGGEPITNRTTRRSLVTHYCPKSAAVPYALKHGSAPVPVCDGGWILSCT